MLDQKIKDLGIAPEFRDILYQDRFPGFSESTVEAYKAIDTLIWAGGLIPGQRLVELDLSNQLAIQRGFIREALRLLAADGIIELVPNKGARLRQLSKLDLIHVTELLNGVFSISVEILINQRPQLTKAQHEALEDATIKIENALDQGGILALASRYIEYHLLLNGITGNPYLNQMMSRMHLSIYHRELMENLSVRMIKEAPPVYRSITKAIIKKDFHTAKTELNRTLDFVKQYLTE